MNINYFSLPVHVKAIKFEVTNWDEVKRLIEFNGGEARLVYTDLHGNPTENITEYKHLVFKGAGAAPAFQVHKGDYVILNGADGMIFPYNGEEFLKFHVADAGEISNGSHTFKQLYESLARFEPTLEEILVSDKMLLKSKDKAVQFFIREHATVHTDSEDKNYYVLHGVVYVD